MKKQIQTIPGYRIADYLLVLDPHEELSSRIMKVREIFAEEYKSEFARWGRPQVALASFKQYELMEDRLVNRLHAVAMGFPAFKVELKDFGSFPSHTIFINVTSKVGVQQLVRQVRTEAQRLMKLDDANKPHFLMEPYITIGRKLLPWQYEKAWLYYSHNHFTGRFIADSMKLLKRADGETKYRIAASFSFQNLPVTTRQGELFG